MLCIDAVNFIFVKISPEVHDLCFGIFVGKISQIRKLYILTFAQLCS